MGRAASRRRKSRLLSPIRSGSTFTLLEELLLELLPIDNLDRFFYRHRRRISLKRDLKKIRK